MEGKNYNECLFLPKRSNSLKRHLHTGDRARNRTRTLLRRVNIYTNPFGCKESNLLFRLGTK
ncbi:hypothetical protein SAMN05444266_104343 [Chitinophaga jiangningensis]|uniref:Uncharacterized protein n=1 Tax=Chitinophaga jiangningensis TaxID=1419482 RepID=A0A1M7CJT5_9BACT|nr:hypothetical protein SAMN05444266_104343 [Chitinophaga jiangningensis]